jgi:hypothetical protein
LIRGSWGRCVQQLAAFTIAIVCALNSSDPVPADDRPEKPITAIDRQHWAFVPVVRPAVPRPQSTVATNPIDAFVRSRLEAEGVPHAPEADRSTVLRRLTLDLTGLPPTPLERETFLNDTSPCAYERLVDRLLASPHYGERWAQHWLDLARYADSDGFEFDQARPDAWRYRDWVVAALNADLPYDEFVRLQLAGDELRPDDPSAFVATGFNRCYPDMVDLNDQSLRRQNALNDMTETTGLVFLGLTIGCARCHDHKFDPIRLSDFYRLEAFFTPARFRDDYPLLNPRERQEHERRMNAWEAEVTRVRAALVRLEAPFRAALALGDPPGLSDETAQALRKPESERSAVEIRLVYEALARDRRVAPDRLATAMQGPLGPIHQAWRTRLDTLLKQAPAPPPRARGLDESGPQAPPTYLLKRGDFANKGAEVQPAFPAVFRDILPVEPELAAVSRSTGRRTALARWLTRPEHPLTARVMVNRLWQHHFGRGLVATPSDLGTMGDPPSHPELLDWLAADLIARGWSLKATHRLMVTSATYRQASTFLPAAGQADPENTLLWRWSRRRLEGEALRDSLLAVSGQLNLTFGGTCVFPELPDELTKLSNKGAVWPVSPSVADRHRRSLYVFLRRNLRYPFFESFDRPDTNASCARRVSTTIAPQALSLLNGKLARDAARAFAKRLEQECGDPHNVKIERAYVLALGRPPEDVERRLAREFLSRGGTWTDYALALMNLNEFVYVD